MTQYNKTGMSRRRFLRLGATSALGTALAACGVKVSSDADTAGTDTAKGSMTLRRNPSTGDNVSLLGYGCMRWPTLPGTDGTVDQEAVNRLVDHALQHGVNYFDTSPAYCKGQSEAAVGEALSHHPRDSYYIATKLSNFAPSTWSREKSIEMFDNSLRLLRTDYIDYMLLHSIGQGSFDAFNSRYIDNGILEFLQQKRREGVVRNLGFSYHGDVAVFDHLLAMHDSGEAHWDFVQIQLNYIDWLHAKEVNPSNTNAEYLYGELVRRGIPAVIMEPLLGGRLASVPQPVAAKMKQRRPDDSVASWAFRFAGTRPGILTVLSGMTYMEHLEDNLRTYSPLEPLTDDDMQFLELAALSILENKSIPCTACNYCMPCPYGIDIPGNFAYYNRCIDDDKVPRSLRDPDYERARRAYLAGYGRTIASGRSAEMCIACGACLSHCPQGIDIPARLQDITDYVESLRQRSTT